MASRTSLVRVGAAVLGVSTALMIGALPAAAGTSDSGQHSSGKATATVIPHTSVDGSPVTMDIADAEGGGTTNTVGQLNKIQVVRDGVPDDKPVDSYCIDLTTGLDKTTTMTGDSWSDFIGRTGSTFHQYNEQINWILQNSYPSVDTSTLSKAAGLTDTISVADAISGTQAAIWHYSDGASLSPDTKGLSADLAALYAYLTNPAKNKGIAEGTIGISPEQATGAAGKLVGPFTVSTNLSALTLSTDKLPSGVTIVDAKGKQLSKSDLADGSKFYFDVAASATATTGSVLVSGTTPSGMIFTAPHSQELIATGATTVAKQATATWTQAGSTAPTTPTAAGGTTPQSQPLAWTGVSTTGPIVLGVLLIAAGGLFLLVQRRLKRAS